ncbi:MAG: HTH-type transcriptional regulator LysM [Nitrososphaerota archaeon]
MDELDKKILQILKEDGRRPFVEIGKEIGLSEAAVRRRVQNLVKGGIIKRFTIDVEKGGASALTMVAVSPSVPTSTVSSTLMKIQGVETVYEITGQYDIAVLISGSSIAEINSCVDEIRRIDGVLNTNTVIILRKFG